MTFKIDMIRPINSWQCKPPGQLVNDRLDGGPQETHGHNIAKSGLILSELD